MSKVGMAHPTASDLRGIVIKINKSAKDVEEAFHARMCEAAEEQCGNGDAQACRTACEDCRIEVVCASTEVKPAATCLRFPDHKSETQAMKEALKKAWIEAEVKHGRGTAWGWLEINIYFTPPKIELFQIFETVM